MTIVAAADGSALGNPGPAGWAWYVDDNCWRSGGWDHGTNNMGELMAVLDLFKSTAHIPEEPLHILCDSQYVINSVTKWMPGWKRKGWKKSDGKPVLNLELLKEIDALLVGRKYTFEWVKGHAGHELNEAADVRARDAATAHQAKRLPNAGPGFPGSSLNGSGASTAQDKFDAGMPGTSQVTPAAARENVQNTVRNAVQPILAGTALFDEPDLFSMLEDEPDPFFVVDRAASVDDVVELERELLDPAVRTDPLRLAELLHPDFEEIGASGQLWSRKEMIEALVDEAAAEAELEVLALNKVDAATALLTYRSITRSGNTLRSSLWSLADGQWRLRFHQGTREA
ncbi:ribonuclease H [Arthrobacter sp. PAMC 25486]|uniref:ribonuclease HI family protein n=1 Tax=Arthrobacter sp. PAMC 25486 TaxID=1494608 RepID=UPI00053606EC|nr:ribonuclease HI family protein [Arthrobacter sp. PAMC 25486]AIY03289.1 ribonuclease H [Arthrobacter sp. PAMC 25486]